MKNQSDYQFLSDLERKVWDWLVKNNIPFDTQQTMFGMQGDLGSATIDFIIIGRNLVLRVMGSYFHSGLESQARDEFGKERLMGKGYIVVDLLEANLSDERIDHTMRLALQGQEVLK